MRAPKIVLSFAAVTLLAAACSTSEQETAGTKSSCHPIYKTRGVECLPKTQDPGAMPQVSSPMT